MTGKLKNCSIPPKIITFSLQHRQTPLTLDKCFVRENTYWQSSYAYLWGAGRGVELAAQQHVVRLDGLREAERVDDLTAAAVIADRGVIVVIAAHPGRPVRLRERRPTHPFPAAHNNANVEIK